MENFSKIQVGGVDCVVSVEVRNYQRRITLDTLVKPEFSEEKPVYTDGNWTFYYGENDGLVRFSVTNAADTEHGPDYHWSSHASLLSKLGFKCTECTVRTPRCSYSAAITMATLRKICRELGYGLGVEIDDWGEINYVLFTKADTANNFKGFIHEPRFVDIAPEI